MRGVGDRPPNCSPCSPEPRSAPSGQREHGAHSREPPARARSPLVFAPRERPPRRGTGKAFSCPALFKYLEIIVFGFEGRWESLTARELLNPSPPRHFFFFFFLINCFFLLGS